MQISMTIRVEFPALDDLVAFLRERSGGTTQQAEIDRLTTQVDQLTGRLNQSTEGLRGPVENS